VSSDQTVTFWIEQLKAGNHDAAQLLWERYFSQMVRLAYQRLQGSNRAAADEEDVALSAFRSFCEAAGQGRFPLLNDRDDLWALLVALTDRKAISQRRAQSRLKRGGGKVVNQSVLSPSGADQSGESPLGQVAGREPGPDFIVQMTEQCQLLLAQLPDDLYRRIAVDKMEGFSNEELSAKLGLALRTIERKLALIRRIWEK